MVIFNLLLVFLKKNKKKRKDIKNLLHILGGARKPSLSISSLFTISLSLTLLRHWDNNAPSHHASHLSLSHTFPSMTHLCLSLSLLQPRLLPTIMPLELPDDDDLHIVEETQFSTPHKCCQCPTLFHHNSSQSLNVKLCCVVTVRKCVLLDFCF